MAIYSAVPPPPQLVNSTTATGQNGTPPQEQHHHHQQQQQQKNQHVLNPAVIASAPESGVDIDAWTISALESLSVSPIARGTGTPLSIPLDDNDRKKPSVVSIQDPRARSSAVTPPPRPPSRRDSMKRREALLKGKEGSRQRRRWENDRLIGVPNAQPPQPFDWEPRPTHPVHHIPYQIAMAWDLRVRAEVEKKRLAATRRKQTQTRTLGDVFVAGRVPRELFLRAKKTPAVRTWVRSLEEPVRKYLVEREVVREETPPGADSDEDGDGDTEDEEIVFVGRNGSMRDGWKKVRREEKGGKTKDEGMVLDALGDDDGGAFRRWITHSISDYYGLHSHSMLVGDPQRKVVYLGMKTGYAAPPIQAHLPRPLWELC